MDEVETYNKSEHINSKFAKISSHIKLLKFADQLALFDERVDLPLLNFIRQEIQKK